MRSSEPPRGKREAGRSTGVEDCIDKERLNLDLYCRAATETFAATRTDAHRRGRLVDCFQERTPKLPITVPERIDTEPESTSKPRTSRRGQRRAIPPRAALLSDRRALCSVKRNRWR